MTARTIEQQEERMRVLRGMVGAAALLLGLTLTACGADETSSPPAETTATTADESAAATPEPDPADPPVFTRSWTDKDGYTWEAELQLPSIEIVDTNTIDQKPGEAQITYKLNGTGTITHTTPGRNSDKGSSMGSIWPVWAPGSAMCDLHEESRPVEIQTSSDKNEYIGETATFEDTGYCVDISAFQTTDREGTWAEGEQRETYMGITHTSLGPLRQGRDRESAAKIIVAETDLEQVLASLKEPAFWAMSGSTIRSTGGLQTESLKTVPEGTCFVGTYDYLATATPHGEEVCDLPGWLSFD